MTVTDRITPNVEFPVTGGGFSPPDPPENDGGGPSPDNERGRLMLLIHSARGDRRTRRAGRARAASLRYLQGQTGYPSTRLWRAVEDLEDLGYVEVFREEPKGPVSRWLAGRRNPNDRVFASTFLVLTKAGRYSPELEESLAESGEPGRRMRFRGVIAAMKSPHRMPSKLCGLPAKLTERLVAEWRAAGAGDPERRALARLNLIVFGLGALCLAGFSASMITLAVLDQTG